MLTLRPKDPVAIGKQGESPDAPVILISLCTIDSADVDGVFLPGERAQQDKAPPHLHGQERPTDVPPDATPIRSDVQVGLIAIAFVGLLCATVIGFVLEIQPLSPGSPEYGYDEALGTETSPLSSANVRSNCSDDSLATAGASKDSLDRLMVSAIAAHVASPTFTPRQ